MTAVTPDPRDPRRPTWEATIGEAADELSPVAADSSLSAAVLPQLAPARYAVGEFLGSGARGQVFRARDRQLDRDVAVKFLAPEHVRDGRKLAAFIHEARVTAGLDHSSILPVHELDFTAQGVPYFTMRVARGMTLGTAIRLAAAGNPPPEICHLSDRIAVFMRVCDALAYAHEQGIIHRDLKPDNLILGGFGEVLVLDWGTAEAVSRNEIAGLENSGTDRQAGLVGTPAYMSPEQARREPADQRSDIYALGATLFHLLTLRHPLWLNDPDAFWAAKRRGEVQPLTNDEKTRLPAALVEIVMRALAVEPQQRFASVSAMQLAIREWQAHAESLQLMEHGRAALAGAARTVGYAAFNDAASAFRTALAMWPGNLDAVRGLREAVHAHARRALQVGDLGLAQVLAHEAGDPAFAERAVRRRRRMRLLRVVALSLALMVCALTGRLAWNWWRQFATWETVLDRDFTGQLAVPGQRAAADQAINEFELTYDDVLRVLPPPVREVAGVQMPAMHTWWIEPLRVRGDVRIEVDLEWTKRVDALEVIFNAHREQPPSWWMVPSGYSCQFAGWNGRTTFLSTNEIAQEPVTADAIQMPFVVNRPYHLVVQRLDDRLSMLVDGHEVVARQEMLPLVGTGYDRIAMRTWSEALIRRVRVLRRAIPENASPLVAGDALVSDGRFASAAQIYEEIAFDRPGTVLARRALAKACVALVRLGDDFAPRRARLRDQLAGTPEADVAWQAEALGAWRAERWQAALQALDRLSDPQSRAALALLAIEHRPLAPGIGNQLLQRIARLNGVTRLDLSHLGLTDISALQGMRLQALDLRGNPLADVTPLRGLPLTDLVLGDTDVSDLEPLRGMPLTHLACDGTVITDLTPLQGMPLEQLDVSSTRVTDLSPLAGMRLLQLTMNATDISDLAPLRGMPLTHLSLNETKVTDLRPLQGLPLEQLDAERGQLTSLEGLQHMPLARLTLSNNPLTDLTPMRGLPLNELQLSQTQVRDLEPLRGMALRQLSLAFTQIADLSPLAGMPLINLSLSGTRITSLAPLNPQSLRTLYIDHTLVQDVSPVAAAPFEVFSAVGTPVRNLGGLEHHPPRQFLLDSPALATSIEALKVRFDVDPARRQQAHTLRVLTALRDGNRDDAQALADSGEGKRYLLVPVKITFAQARDWAKLLGGRIVMPQSLAEQRQVVALLGINGKCWIGLLGDGQEDHWLNGVKVGWSCYRRIGNGSRDGAAARPYVIVANIERGAWMAAYANDMAELIIEWDAP